MKYDYAVTITIKPSNIIKLKKKADVVMILIVERRKFQN